MRAHQSKIITLDALAPQVATLRKEGKKVGFTSGAFDLLHAGHVSYLEKAKEHCDVLIVGINTDASVADYKGPGRPIVAEAARVAVVAALESVDYVFTFSERRNRTNIETLKPVFYIKAGDYKPSELTSSDVVEKYGGKTIILPMEEGFSTTNLIKKISSLSNLGGETSLDPSTSLRVNPSERIDESVRAVTEKREPQKAVFIDRDGTINKEVEYLHEPEKFKLTPNAAEGIKKFQDLGYKIIVWTLQAGIGLGYFTKEDFYKVNQEMFTQLQPLNITIDKIYFATHSKNAEGTNAKTVLIKRGRDELDLDLQKCVVVGDKLSDIKAGQEYGCVTIGVTTGHALKDTQVDVKPDFVASDLLAAATWLEKKV